MKKPPTTHFYTYIQSVSCNLSSIQLLISVRVVLWSLSALLHLHKIKDACFLCHCLPIERNPLPQCDDLGPLWPTWGQSINTQLERLVSECLEAEPQITVCSPWITLCCIMLKKSRDNTAKSRTAANELDFFLQTCTWPELNQSVMSGTLSSCYCSEITNPELQGLLHQDESGANWMLQGNNAVPAPGLDCFSTVPH